MKNENKKNMSSKNLIEAYLLDKYEFRYNLYTSSVEFKENQEKSFKAMKDFDLNSMVRELDASNLKTSKAKLDNLLQSDFSQRFDPLKEYIKSLPKWDEKIDYIAELASKVKTDDDGFFADAFKRWIVALVACGLNEAITNQTMIVFAGGQGIGKSTYIQKLLPLELRDYTYSGMINTKSKDTLIFLSECLIIDLDELSNLTRKGNAEMKELITKSKTKLRRAYGRLNENFVRRASFIGSINEEEFLSDLTGNRRYLCFKVKSIAYKDSINHVGVYSQAYHLYKQKFKFHFDYEEIDLINQRNENFRRKSLIEEILLKTYTPAKDKYKAHFYLSSTEILIELTKNTRLQLTDTNSIQLGKLLSSLGFSRIKKKGISKYAVDRVILQGEAGLHKVS